MTGAASGDGDDAALRRSGDGEYVWQRRIIDTADGALHVLVALARFPGGLPDEMELIFAILKIAGDDVKEYFDGRQTRGLLCDANARRRALNAALRGIRAVVDAARPRLLTFFTYSADLPPKALAKHLKVVEALKGQGYRLVSQSTMYGRESWTMERRDD